MERDLSKEAEVSQLSYFNSHAHVERDQTSYPDFKKDINFNSHAHVERDITKLFGIVFFIISTHTLTWSVTVEIYVVIFCQIFQLTRSRGA